MSTSQIEPSKINQDGSHNTQIIKPIIISPISSNFTKEINNDIVSNVDVNLYVNEISGQVNYKVTPYLGLGAGIGYRNLLNKKSVLNTTFDAPIYIAKIIIYPGGFFQIKD